MNLIACGINHQTAPLPIREQLVFCPEIFPTPLQALVECTQAQEALILSTCNRTEFYCVQAKPENVITWLHQYKQLSQDSLHPYLYSYEGLTVLRHLLRVASGLDSMVMGETQILAQVKAAFFLAQASGTVGSQLRRLFQYVFSASKEVRTRTEIGRYPLSIAFTVVDLAKRIFADLTTLGVLLVGAGDIIALVAKHLMSRGVNLFWIANRTPAHAAQLAQSLQGLPVSLSAIPECLVCADIVITATASPLPLIGKGIVESALRRRKRRPMLMIDLAVPRDIEQEVSQLQDVYLYNLDDLQAIIQQHLNHRSSAAAQAETIIDTKVIAYKHSLAALAATPLIAAYRKQAEQIRDAALAKALLKLQQGVEVEQVVKSLAVRLTNQLIHTPSAELRNMAYLERQECLAIAAQLLGLQTTV